MYCSIILFDKPLSPLTYRLNASAQIGTIVQAPLGRRSYTGIITDIFPTEPAYTGYIRNIIEIIDPNPFISPPLMAMLRFMANYYFCPLSTCLKLALPGGMMRSGSCRYTKGNIHSVPDGLFPDNPQNSLFKNAQNTPIDALFQTLDQNPNGMDEADIRKLCAIDAQTFQTLVQCGALIPNWQLSKARATESTETFYTLTDTPPQTCKNGKPRKLGPKQQQILQWIAQKTHPVPYHEILKNFGPCHDTLHRLAAANLLKPHTAARDKSSFDDIRPIIHDISPTEEQQQAIHAINSHEGFGTFLLFGVTGSGKTEVYLQAIENTRKKNKGCIFILPEIALTPQFCAVFRGRFGNDVAVLHSALGEKERFDTWTRIRNGRLGIVIGPRSALFAPIQNLGLIVIDEEHDPSFKQSETPRYHARDMALVLGQNAQCPVILGSATPSLESYTRALQNKSTLLLLTRRPQARPMPEISIVDMRAQIPQPHTPTDLADNQDTPGSPSATIPGDILSLKPRLISPQLENALEHTLQKHEQAMIFLNRRGFSTFVQCLFCGHVLYCPNCDVALTYYKYANKLRCHYCNYETPCQKICPKCGRNELSYTGYGTERLVALLQTIFPNARIDRLDRDRATTQTIQNVLENFRNGNIDFLVGTQMIAKGHDIHNVTLVGIINADMGLHLPDFRASERTYQLLTQVSGRAGRGNRPGLVILQTLTPKHPAIEGIAERNYSAFAHQELEIRRALSNPPFSSMILIKLEGEQPMDVENYATAIARTARAVMPMRHTAKILGPAPAPIPMLRGKYRYQLFLRLENRQLLHQWLAEILKQTPKSPKIHMTIDVDPYEMT